MGLQRWEPTTRYIGTGEYMGDMEQDAEGDFYAADDVDALIARIRAAVEAERGAPRGVESCDDPDCGCWDSYNEARAALDALLADGGCQTMDTSRTQAIAEAHQRALSDELLAKMLREGGA